jgi:hypothetical protein
MLQELIDMLERVLDEAVLQDPFQGDDYALLQEAQELLAKVKAAQKGAQPTLLEPEQTFINCAQCGRLVPSNTFTAQSG